MSEKTKQEKKVIKPSSKSFLVYLNSAILVIAVVAVLGCAYNWYQLRGVKQAASSANQTMLAQQQKNQAALKSLKKTITQQKDLIKANKTQLGQLNESVNGSQSSWLLADAKYLLKMANVTLRVGDNIPTTIALLKTADQRLATADQPGLLTVRKQLAKEILSLQSLPKLDKSGLYLKLQALAEATEKLPMALKNYQQDKVDNLLAQSSDKKDSAWAKAWQAFKHALSKVIILRKRSEQVKPLISTKQDIVLKQNIALLYSQAQWAVLQANPEVYQASLKKLQQLIPNYFVPDNKTQAVQKALASLLKVKLAAKLPSISQSLTSLEAYMQAPKTSATKGKVS